MDATCTATGLTEGKKCSVCGEILKAQEVTVKLAHTEGEAVVENEVKATCEAAGSYDSVVYCSVCNEELSRETITVDALSHNMQETTAAVAPTCETAGSTAVYTCANNCGKTEGGEAVDALGHNYDSVVTAPTCAEAGYTIYTCSVCTDTYTADEVAALGHTPAEAVKENEVEADYDRKGRYDSVVYCSVCDAELSRETISVDALVRDEPTFRPSVEDTEDGKIKVSPKNPKRGDRVTITVTPDKGYEIGEVFVIDRKGNEVAVRDNGDGTYTFKQPYGKVEIEVEFLPIEIEDEEEIVFFDVNMDAYYYDAVQWAVESGITNGMSATAFGPNVVCNRAQVVTFLWRAAGSPEPESTVMPFVDVAPGAYYYDAVLWAVENGITTGMSANTFAPNGTVTRGQTVTFLWRAEGKTAADGQNGFSDVATDAYYEDAVQWAVENGITNGMSDTSFAPASGCTRGQIVTFLYRCMAK